jgi:heme A synthase
MLTAILTFLLMVMGGVVRVTGSGLGCPDWPTCYGRLIPPLELHSIIEYSHRSIAALAGTAIIATVVAAWLRYRHERWIVWPATAILGLLAAQVPLGALVVATELESALVAFHLGMALLIFACTLTVVTATYRLPLSEHLPVPVRYRLLLTSLLIALFVTLSTGALVVGSQASLACPDWPLCHGGLVVPANGSPLIAIHLLHRYMVAATAILTAVVIVQSLRKDRKTVIARMWPFLLGALFIGQISIGAIQVWLVMPALWRALHLATACAVWAVIVIMTVEATMIAHRTPVTDPAQAANLPQARGSQA